MRTFLVIVLAALLGAALLSTAAARLGGAELQAQGAAAAPVEPQDGAAQELIKRFVLKFNVTLEGKPLVDAELINKAVLCVGILNEEGDELIDMRRGPDEFDAASGVATWDIENFGYHVDTRFSSLHLFLPMESEVAMAKGINDFADEQRKRVLTQPKARDGSFDLGEMTIELTDLLGGPWYRLEGKLAHFSGETVLWPNIGVRLLSESNTELLQEYSAELSTRPDGSFGVYRHLTTTPDDLGIASADGTLPESISGTYSVPYLSSGSAWMAFHAMASPNGLSLTKTGPRTYTLSPIIVDLPYVELQIEVDIGEAYIWEDEWQAAVDRGETPKRLPINRQQFDGVVEVEFTSGAEDYENYPDWHSCQAQLSMGRAKAATFIGEHDYEMVLEDQMDYGAPNPAEPEGEPLRFRLAAAKRITGERGKIQRYEIKLQLMPYVKPEPWSSDEVAAEFTSEALEIEVVVPKDWSSEPVGIDLIWENLAAATPSPARSEYTETIMSHVRRITFGYQHLQRNSASVKALQGAKVWAEISEPARSEGESPTQGASMRRYGLKQARISSIATIEVGADGIYRAKIEIAAPLRELPEDWFRDYDFRVNRQSADVSVSLHEERHVTYDLKSKMTRAKFLSLDFGDAEIDPKDLLSWGKDRASNLTIDLGVHAKDASLIRVEHLGSGFTMSRKGDKKALQRFWMPPGEVVIVVEMRDGSDKSSESVDHYVWKTNFVVSKDSYEEWRLPERGADIDLSFDYRDWDSFADESVELLRKGASNTIDISPGDKSTRVEAGEYRLRAYQRGLFCFEETRTFEAGQAYRLDYARKIWEMPLGALRIRGSEAIADLSRASTMLYLPHSRVENLAVLSHRYFDANSVATKLYGSWHRGDLIFRRLPVGSYGGGVVVVRVMGDGYQYRNLLYHLPPFEVSAEQEVSIKPRRIESDVLDVDQAEEALNAIANLQLRVDAGGQYLMSVIDDEGLERSKEYLAIGENYRLRLEAVNGALKKALPQIEIPFVVKAELAWTAEQQALAQAWLDKLDKLVTPD